MIATICGVEVIIIAREYLISLRNQRKETQQDVANALGISRQYYSLIEDGSRQQRMDIALATALATHFQIPISEIISNEETTA